MTKASIKEVIKEIEVTVPFEIATEIFYVRRALTKKETFIITVKTIVQVVWGFLLEATCIHREKEYWASCGPESGWEEFVCKRCGRDWNYIYY